MQDTVKFADRETNQMDFTLPEYSLNIKRDGDHLVIFDTLRDRFVALTPEEWVRQRFVRWLIEERGFRAGLMGNEVSIIQNGIKRRCDTIVHDGQGAPLVIIEYKAPHVVLTQKVFDQIVRYNMVLHARYLIVSNGVTHYCCHIDYDSHSYCFLDDIPNYDQLK